MDLPNQTRVQPELKHTAQYQEEGRTPVNIVGHNFNLFK